MYFFTNEHQIIKYCNDVDTQVNRSFLQSIKDYKSTKENADNQVRDITLNSAISSIEDEDEYVEMIVDTDLLFTVLSKLKKERFESYDSWIRIGFIVFNELGSRGFDIWHSFSKRASNYKSEQDCRYHWNTFAKRAKKLTIRSLFYYLKEDNKTAFNELSKDYYMNLTFESIQVTENKDAHYMDYLDRKEWKLNTDLMIYLKQRAFYYERAGNIWYTKQYDPIQKKYSFVQTKDTE